MNNLKEKFLIIFRKKNSGQKRSLICGACSKEKTEKYCNFCNKETSNIYTLMLIDTFTIRESMGMKQKRPGISGYLVQMFKGFKPSVKDDKFPEGVDLYRKLDREKDWYDEVVKDEKTEKIVNECHEPLSQHTGHGSAKMR